MAGNRSTNTQAEALQGLLGQIADMKVMPDADMPYLTNLETMVLGYLRAPFEAQQASQQVSAAGAQGMGASPLGQPGPPGMGAPAGLPPQLAAALGGGGGMGGPPMAPPAPALGRVPGVMQGAQMPPVDELRRLMTQGH